MINMGNDCDISDILHLMNLITFSEIGCKGTPKNGMNLNFTYERLFLCLICRVNYEFHCLLLGAAF